MRNELLTMTPELASMYLEMNTGNRKARHHYVNELAEAIKRGEWKCSPHGAIVSKDLRLLDGQHRLMAIKKSGCSVPMVVWSGVDDDVFDCIDHGIKRTTADVTRLDKRKVETLNLIHVFIGRMSRPTPNQIYELNNIFGALCDELLLYAPKATKGFSAVGVRTAAVILMAEGKSASVLPLYRQLTLLDFDGIPEITKNFTRQVLTKTLVAKMSSGGGAQIATLVKAVSALDTSLNRKMIPFSDTAREETKKRVLAIIEKSKGNA